MPNSLKPYSSIGDEERDALLKVVESGVLSGFLAGEPEGGPKVRELEDRWRERFGVHHAVSVNSATSGLLAALTVMEAPPGAEVLVPCWTMSASASMIVAAGYKPVFVDVDPRTFCIDPADMVKKITLNTWGVVVVHLFGHPADMDKIVPMCKKHNIFIIEDCAQAPLASINGRLTGTFGDIGVFSLNYHKHIHCGEGGMCVTWSPSIAKALKAVRNHGEVFSSYIGYNFRLPELSAAVAIVQLEKISVEVARARKQAQILSNAFEGVLTTPYIQHYYQHSFYMWCGKCSDREFAEGHVRRLDIPCQVGYVKPLYKLLPFMKYAPEGGCPVAEKLQEQTLLIECCAYEEFDL